MEITKITIIPKGQHVDRKELEDLRATLEIRFNAKIYFETQGETIADVIIEKELKQVVKK